MSIDEKRKIAETEYLKRCLEIGDFIITRLEDLKADYFVLNKLIRGMSGIIIGDDGSFLTCGSAYPLSDYIEDFKNGIRDSNDLPYGNENDVISSKVKMKLNGQDVYTEKELIDFIKKGIDPIKYIENQEDIAFISSAIVHRFQLYDPFWDDMAEQLLKTIITYIITVEKENKTLKRCIEISNLLVNKDILHQLFDSVNDEKFKSLYKNIEQAPDRTYNSIVETLIQKISDFNNVC